eukprot:13878963-Heterocapsa_arctica.AAC.1
MAVGDVDARLAKLLVCRTARQEEDASQAAKEARQPGSQAASQEGRQHGGRAGRPRGIGV